jgi:hypothetical protein
LHALDVDLDNYQANFAKFPGLARERGHIGLQDYSPGLEFRDRSNVNPTSYEDGMRFSFSFTSVDLDGIGDL